MSLVAGAQEAARPSSSSRPPRRCAAAHAALSCSGQCSGFMQRGTLADPSVTRDLRSKVSATNAENRLGVMTGRRCALGTGIKADRRLDVLMAEKLTHDFVLAGIMVQENLCNRMAEPMRWHVQPCQIMNEFSDLHAQHAVSLGSIGALTGEQEWAGTTKQQWPPTE